MAVAALPFMLCILPPMIWYCLRVRRMFVSTSRELKRFEGLSRSLIFATLNESITGTSTIRSNGAKQFIIDKFEEHHDSHSRAFWSFLASTRYLGFQLTFLMFIFNCSACFIAVLFSEQGRRIYSYAISIHDIIFELTISFQIGSELTLSFMDWF